MLNFFTQTVVGDALLWSLSAAVIALLCNFYFKQRAPVALLTILAGYLVVGVGLVSTGVIAVFLLAAGFVGRALYRFAGFAPASANVWGKSIILGAAAYLLIWSVLLDYPVDSRWLHLGLIVVPVAIGLYNNRKSLMPELRASMGKLEDQLQCLPYWLLTLSLIVIGWTLRFAFMPTVGHDDNVLHLRIWTELTDHQYFNYDLKNEIWSLAPNLVDVGHAVLSLIAGSDSRSALNLVLGIALCVGLLHLLALSAANLGARLLILVLFASTPLFAYQLTTLQTELMLAVLLVIGSNLALRLKTKSDLPGVLAITAVCAMSLATKLPGLFIGASVVAMSLANMAFYGERTAIKTTVRPYRLIGLLLGLGALATISYVKALIVTGNPVFPLMNGVFKSPYFEPINFADFRYLHGLSLATYWDMFFNTSKYNETQNYTAGIQYLFLAPLGLLLACVSYRKSPIALVAIPVLLYGGIMFSQIQYLRYLFPVMPLLCVAMISLVTLSPRWLHRLFIASILVCIAFNLSMMSKASWYMNTPMGQLYSTLGKRLAESRIIPEKAVNAFVSEHYPGASVLYVNNPFGASLHGKPITLNWHAPENYTTIRSVKTQENLIQMLHTLQPDFIMRSTEEGKKEWQKIPQRLIREHLVNYGYPEHGQGNVILYRLTKDPIAYSSAKSRDSSKPYLGVRQTKPYALTGDNIPLLLDSFHTEGKRHLKYTLVLDCRQGNTVFNAQINWDTGGFYFRPVKCDDEVLNFNESLPIPQGATYGEISLSARQLENKATVEYLNVGLN